MEGMSAKETIRLLDVDDVVIALVEETRSENEGSGGKRNGQH